MSATFAQYTHKMFAVECLFVYLHDNSVFEDENGDKIIKSFFLIFCKNNLKISLSKCTFDVSYFVSAGRIYPINMLMNWHIFHMQNILRIYQDLWTIMDFSH